MITIIHGDNTVLSRKQLQTELEKHSLAGKKIRSLTSSDLTLAIITEALQSTSLFGDEAILVIERLFTMRAKNLRDQIFAILDTQAGIDVILWEDRVASATSLKLFTTTKPTILSFKTSPVVFQAMDLLGNHKERSRLLKLLHAAYEQDSVEFVFSMIARQVRLLINVLEGETGAMKPYTLTKIRQQARFFSLEKLVQMHQQLLAIDMAQKQSASLLTLEQQLDLFALQSAT